MEKLTEAEKLQHNENCVEGMIFFIEYGIELFYCDLFEESKSGNSARGKIVNSSNVYPSPLPNSFGLTTILNFMKTCKAAQRLKSNKIWKLLLPRLWFGFVPPNNKRLQYYKIFLKHSQQKHLDHLNRRKEIKRKMCTNGKKRPKTFNCCKCTKPLVINSHSTKLGYVWIYKGTITTHAPQKHHLKTKSTISQCFFPALRKQFASVELRKLSVYQSYVMYKPNVPKATQLCINCLKEILTNAEELIDEVRNLTPGYIPPRNPSFPRTGRRLQRRRLPRRAPPVDEFEYNSWSDSDS